MNEWDERSDYYRDSRALAEGDAAAGMQPDVVCPAEDLPFADGSFDDVVCRVAAHHFTDPWRAVSEMARVTRRRRSPSARG